MDKLIAIKAITSIVSLAKNIGLLDWIKSNNQTTFSKAFVLTVKEFEYDFVQIEEQLSKFLSSESNMAIMEFMIRTNQADLSLLVDQFIKEADFYLPEQDEVIKVASTILDFFFNALTNELLTSETGLLIHDEREAERSDHIRRQVDRTVQMLTDRRIVAENTQIKWLQDRWKSQFERIEQIEKENGIKASLGRWEDLYQEINGEKIQDLELRFEVCTRLGSTYFKTYNESKAIEFFTEAYLIKRTDKRARLNRSLAFMLERKYEDAYKMVDDVMAEYPGDESALAIKGSIFINQELYTPIIEMYSVYKDDRGSLALSRIDCFCQYAIAFFENGDITECLNICDQALRLESDVSGIKAILAAAIVCSIKDDKKLVSLSQSDIDRLRYAESLLNEIIEHFEKQDNIEALANSLTNRVTVRIFLGDEQNAISDAKRAFFLNATNPMVVNNYILACIQEHNLLAATDELEKAIIRWKKPEDIALIMQIYVRLNPSSAIKKSMTILSNIYPNEDLKDMPIIIIESLGDLMIEVGDYSEIEEVIDLLKNKKSPHAYIVEATKMLKQSDVSGFKLLLKAEKEVDDNEFLLRIATLYCEYEKWDKAVKTFDTLGINEYSPRGIFIQYLTALYNLKASFRLDEVVLLSKRYRDIHGVHPDITRIEIYVLESRRDFEESKLRWSELIDKFPNDNIYKLGYARCLYRLEKSKEDIYSTLKDIVDISDLSADKLILMAEIYREIGYPENCLFYAYKALNKAKDDPKVNLSYIMLFHAVTQQGYEFQPSIIVEADSIVTLSFDEKTSKTFNLDEIKTDTIRDKLIGKKCYDVIQWNQPPSIHQVATIKNIENKYIKAFQNIFQNFSIIFPGEKGLMAFDPGENLENLFALLDENERHRESALGSFNSYTVPSYSLSKILGLNVLDTWGYIITSKKANVHLIISSGTKQEIIEEDNAVLSQNIVIDAIALLTLKHLDILDKIQRIFDNIFVPRHVYECFCQIIKEWELVKKDGYYNLGKEAGEYVRNEITPEIIKQKIEFLSSITDFCNNIQIVGSPRSFDYYETIYLTPIMGEEHVVPFLLAQNIGGAIYSDDLVTRVIAHDRYGVSGFSTLTVLRVLLDKKLLKPMEYAQLLLNLLKSNYQYIPVSLDLLMFTSSDTSAYMNDNYKRVMQQLFSNSTDTNSAIEIVSIFVHKLLRQKPYIFVEPILQDIMLRIYIKGRSLGIERFHREMMRLQQSDIIKVHNVALGTQYIADWKRKYMQFS